MTQAVTKDTVRNVQEEKRRRAPFAGLIERIRSSRQASEAVSLLESSMKAGGAGGNSFEESLSIFGSLGPAGREKVLSKAAGMFKPYSSFAFESLQKVAALTTLSVFIAEAAALLPRDGEGAPQTSSRVELVRNLKALASDSSFYRSTDTAHSGAKLAAAVGLWELGCMEYGTWEEFLREPATRMFTIAKMLEMPDTGDFSVHGWHLLMKNLDTALAMDIAVSGSQKGADFLCSMMLDERKEVALSAMEGAVYLRPIPPEFLDMAREISARSPEFRTKASYFLSAADCIPYLESADDLQFRAALHLLALYREGMAHLRPLLEGEVAREMGDLVHEPAGASEGERAAQQQKALEVLFQMHLSGLRTQGFTFNIEEG